MFQNAKTGNDASSSAPRETVRPKTRIAKRFHIILMMALELDTFVFKKNAARAMLNFDICFLTTHLCHKPDFCVESSEGSVAYFRERPVHLLGGCVHLLKGLLHFWGAL